MRPDASPQVEAALAEVRDDALRHFAQEQIDADDVQMDRYVSMRYANQEHTLEVPMPAGPIDAATIDG